MLSKRHKSYYAASLQHIDASSVLNKFQHLLRISQVPRELATSASACQEPLSFILKSRISYLLLQGETLPLSSEAFAIQASLKR